MNVFMNAPCRIFRVLPAAVLAFVLSFYFQHTASACSVPVFRYALERWSPESYTAWVLHPGPLRSPQKEAIEALDAFCRKNAVNLTVRTVDTNHALPQALYLK